MNYVFSNYELMIGPGRDIPSTRGTRPGLAGSGTRNPDAGDCHARYRLPVTRYRILSMQQDQRHHRAGKGFARLKRSPPAGPRIHAQASCSATGVEAGGLEADKDLPSGAGPTCW